MDYAQWQLNVIDNEAGFHQIFEQCHRIAVLGIKPDDHRQQPAFYVPEYLQSVGFEIVPIPVYYPEVKSILGQPVFRSLRHLVDPVDMVIVFRRSHDVPQHLDDLLAASPKVVWMQSGISNEQVAAKLASNGIKVVQDRCAMIEHRKVMGSRR